jgi:hypothetical protein
VIPRRLLHCNILVAAAVASAVTCALALGASPALAEDTLTIALYAPNAPFESGEARYSFASRLASHVASATGLTVEPKAYARASDFESAIKKNQVDFAVVDGVYLAERGVPWSAIATTTAGGETTQRWWLVANDPVGVLDLQGKRLAQVQTSGKDAAFVDNVLLEGELPRLFGGRQSVPDVSSAVAAVSLKKADAAFAPESASKSLKRVFDAGKVPNPAFVTVKSSLPKDVVDKVRAAVLSAAGNGPYDGWKSGSSDPYRSIASRLGSRTRRPVMTEPPVVGIDPLQALTLPPLEASQPDLRAQFWAPPARP